MNFVEKSFYHEATNDNDREEEHHYLEVLSCLKNYLFLSNKIISKYKRDFESLSSEHQEMIPFYSQRLDSIAQILPLNQDFLNEICNLHQTDIPSDIRVPAVLQENIKSLFRQLIRDWSSIGEDERRATYQPIIEKLKALFPKPQDVSILVPGAGLGRLVYELSALGFNIQGNEFSLLMLFTSELILNHSSIGKWQIYPFLFPFSNIRNAECQCLAVSIPDIQIDRPVGHMSMTAGDFLEVYAKEEEQDAWDCVVTCFFLDTASNILMYLEIIKKILKSGGYWLNLGPLYYHYEGNASSISIELTLEELSKVILKMGFDIQHQSTEFCTYVQNPQSMLKSVYECSFMIMQKK